MSASARNEQDMKEKAARQLASIKDPIEKIRCLCLQRGTTGIMALGRQFRIMDDNRSGDLSYEEFRNGLNDIGMGGNEEEYGEIFKIFDKDGSGTLKYDEFLRAIRVSHQFVCWIC